MENNLIVPFVFDIQQIDEHLYREIVLFKKKFPDAYLGGSFALNSFGLINRYVGDADFCIHKSKHKEVAEYLNTRLFSTKKQKTAKNFAFRLFKQASTIEQEAISLNYDELCDDGFGGKHIHIWITDPETHLGGKMGVFFVDEPEPTVYCKCNNNDGEIFKISLPDKTIQAKKYYVEQDSPAETYRNIEKHIYDLEQIEKNMENFNRKMFLFYN